MLTDYLACFPGGATPSSFAPFESSARGNIKLLKVAVVVDPFCSYCATVKRDKHCAGTEATPSGAAYRAGISTAAPQVIVLLLFVCIANFCFLVPFIDHAILGWNCILTGLSKLSQELPDGWVTVFGVSQNEVSLVLQDFLKYGDIVEHGPFNTRGESCNWVHIHYKASSFFSVSSTFLKYVHLSGGT